MNKQQFAEALRRGLRGLADADVSRAIDFYMEMIDDQMENGLTESEAISALGSMEEIIRETVGVCGRPQEALLEEEKLKSDAPVHTEGSYAFDGENAPHTLCIETNAIDVVLSADPNATDLLYRYESDASNEEGVPFAISLENGVLTFAECGGASGAVSQLSIFGKRLNVSVSRRAVKVLSLSRTLHITLPARPISCLRMRTVSGGVLAENAKIAKTAAIQTISGDITLNHVACGAEASIHSTSGDVQIIGCSAAQMDVCTRKGDVTLRGIGPLFFGTDDVKEALSIETTNGDVTILGESDDSSADAMSIRVELEGVTLCIEHTGDSDAEKDEICREQVAPLISKGIRIKTMSGDVEIKNVQCSNKLSLLTVSGDVTLENTQSSQLECKTTSGDVSIRSTEAQQSALNTISGEIEAAQLSSNEWMTVRTTSGDITLDSLFSHMLDISSISGDIEAKLRDDGQGYNVLTRSMSGDIHAPHACGEHRATASTTSGDIDIRIA